MIILVVAWLAIAKCLRVVLLLLLLLSAIILLRLVVVVVIVFAIAIVIRWVTAAGPLAALGSATAPASDQIAAPATAATIIEAVRATTGLIPAVVLMVNLALVCVELLLLLRLLPAVGRLLIRILLVATATVVVIIVLGFLFVVVDGSITGLRVEEISAAQLMIGRPLVA